MTVLSLLAEVVCATVSYRQMFTCEDRYHESIDLNLTGLLLKVEGFVARGGLVFSLFCS